MVRLLFASTIGNASMEVTTSVTIAGPSSQGFRDGERGEGEGGLQQLKGRHNIV